MSINIEEKRLIKSKKVEEKKTEVKSRLNISTIKQFAGDVKNEFDKVAWPDKKHTFGSTIVVVILVMIISFYLGGVDLLLGKLIGFVLR